MSPEATHAPSPAESPTRGRPRDDDRTEAILDAAADLMHEVGWEGFRVQDVATRAGAGLATIYRRWPTKEALVAAAMRHDAPDWMESSGDPRTDLRVVLTEMSTKMCGKGGSMIGVLAAARDHDELGSAMDEVMRSAVRTTIRGLIGGTIGDDHPQLDIVTDGIAATLLLRAGIFDEDIDPDAYVSEALALVDALTPGRG